MPDRHTKESTLKANSSAHSGSCKGALLVHHLLANLAQTTAEISRHLLGLGHLPLVVGDEGGCAGLIFETNGFERDVLSTS